jgi:AraC family transcriptional regulator, regulatory protein of adaptative response / DNA-3-methyladenine glycosylase II
VIPDFETCYRAVSSRDQRFDGWFFTAVTSTHIYCRPSCPATTPKRANVRFYPTAAAAQSRGFRACKRCRPDASPGSPEWNVREDQVARAMRLIADGIVDREGVAGLARRLYLSERHLHRQLVAEVGAGPQALARAQRAQAARVLIETTALPFSEVAFSSGFTSIRQFNDTVRQVFASTPSALRKAKRRPGETSAPGTIVLRLAFRAPFDAASLLRFIGERAVPGVEEFDGRVYRRTLGLPRSPGVVELSEAEDHVRCVLRLDDVRDLVAAVQRCRRLLDLDADAPAIDGALREDPRLRPFVDAAPGRRVPGTVDATELAFRAVLGQQVSVKGARTLAGRLVQLAGKPLTAPDGGLTHVFPTSEAVADADLSAIGMPESRRKTLRTVAATIADGAIPLHPGASRDEVGAKLLELRGIGPWTASYVLMRGLGDPDAFLPGDLGVKKAMTRIGLDGDAEAISRRWSPWRSYALQHLWATLEPGVPSRARRGRS